MVRIDLADRLASHARKVRSAGGDEPVDVQLATSLGLADETIARLMSEVGYAKAGGGLAVAWAPSAAGTTAGPARSHAFAELAKLSGWP